MQRAFCSFCQQHCSVWLVQAETVNKGMAKIKKSLNSSGVLTHEHVPACTDCELLGLRVDGKQKELRMSSRRYWRIKYALEWDLQARKASGKQLERIIGHTTFASLLERITLSIPHSVYKFIRKQYDSTARLWKKRKRGVTSIVGSFAHHESTAHT